MQNYLDFEKPISDLESKIEELRHLSDDGDINIADEVTKLQAKADKTLRQIYAKLSPWQKVLVARHPERPHTVDYISALIEDFTPLAGDRGFAEDRAIVGGLGRFNGHAVVVLGHEKGADTQARMTHNFGMARPEGYRKAIRLMELAERFSLPILTLIDTPGAYPGVGAEERGQAEAIARSIETCLSLKVPLISVVIGEGGSGGAIALAAANAVLMLENAVYSVISPEGCASILWRSGDQAKEAAEAMKLTANDLLDMKIIDDIISEPVGGAHRHPVSTIKAVGDAIDKALGECLGVEPGALRQRRRDKFLEMGRQGLS